MKTEDSKPNHNLKIPPCNTTIWGINFQTHEIWKTLSKQSTTKFLHCEVIISEKNILNQILWLLLVFYRVHLIMYSF